VDIVERNGIVLRVYGLIERTETTTVMCL
jgi:hypothetical protein